MVYLDLCAHVEELAGIKGMWDSRIELGRTSSEEQADGGKKTKEAHTERREKNKLLREKKRGSNNERKEERGMRKRERSRLSLIGPSNSGRARGRKFLSFRKQIRLRDRNMCGGR